jgi:hypothetical protein
VVVLAAARKPSHVSPGACVSHHAAVAQGSVTAASRRAVRDCPTVRNADHELHLPVDGSGITYHECDPKTLPRQQLR